MRRLASICLILIVAAPLFAVEEEILLGGEDQWQEIALMVNARVVEGYRGEGDLVLENDGVDPTAASELFLPFDQEPYYDRAGSYRIRSGAPAVADVARFGRGAALFEGDPEGLLLEPSRTTLFAPGSMLGDFSIDFWYRPTVVDQGQTIFHWEGSIWNGNAPVSQEIMAQIGGQSIEWRLENLFVTPDGETRSLRLRGRRPVIPRRWAHHQLTYDASLGLFEYTVDGTPEAVAYATTTGGEPGELLYGRIGSYGSGELRVGSGLQGILDELRITRGEEPRVLRTSLTGEPGEVITRSFDLGLRGSRLLRVESQAVTPEDTEVQLFYRISDDLESPMPERAIDAPWTIVPPSGVVDGARGRFLQLRALLLSGGDREMSPRLSRVRVVYEPVAPPPPPPRIRALPGNGKVEVEWAPVRMRGIVGYRVYYGTAPGQYFGSAELPGASPIDAGSATSLRIDGLENGVLYFFAVESYDRFGNYAAGELSQEVSARPMGWRELNDP